MALADLLPLSYVEIGKIKIGRKKPRNERGWCPPEKLDHFLITTLHRGGDENLIVDQPLMDSLKDYADKSDGKLRSIPVMFGSNDIEDVLVTSYTWYIGKTCGARTDGVTITFYADPETGKLLPEPRRYKWHDSYLDFPDPCSRQPKPLLKRFSTLNCMIASPSAKFGGFYRFRTTSEISSRQLYGSLMTFCGPKGLCPGVLRGLPFRLVVRPMQVAPEGKATTVQVVHVEYMHSDLAALQAAAQSQRELEFKSVEMLFEADQKMKMLVAAQKVSADLDDEDLADEPKEALPVLQLGAKGPDRAQQQAQEQGAILEKIAVGIAACNTVEEINAFWNTGIKPAEIWNKLDKAMTDDVKKVWGDRKHAILNPPKPADEAPVQDAEFSDAGGPEAPGESESAEDGPAMPENQDAEPVKAVEPAKVETPAQPPLKAGKNIIDTIIKILNGRPYEEVRAKYQKELGITAGRMADLTAPQALGLIEKLRAEAEGGAS